MKLKRNENLAQSCYEMWQTLAPLRYERDRNIRYKNGLHWEEMVPDPDNKSKLIREEELITREGKIALKHNFINQFVRNILGQIIKNPTQSVIHTRCRNNQKLGEMLTNTLQSSLKENLSKMQDVEVCEELILCGMACCKVRYDYNSITQKGQGVLSTVNFNNLFFNDDIGDCRLSNLRVVGQLHDMTYDELMLNFATSPQSENVLKKMFMKQKESYSTATSSLDNSTNPQKDFMQSHREGFYRVIEVWQKQGRWVKQTHDAENGILYSEEVLSKTSGEEVYEYCWNVTFMTSDGYILKESQTPFNHNLHPYVFAVLPFTNGEIKSLIGDLIDIQRYINRLIIMLDFIIGSSAKGVLMIPETSIPDGYSVEDFTREYVKTNGVIVYKPSATREVPFQITANSTNVGAWEMLSMQMNLIQQIAGISGAIQGHSSRSQMASSLYSQQAENSQLNHQVLFEAFRIYKEQRDEKLLRVLMQYYKEPRTIGLCTSCRRSEEEFMTYDPELLGDLLDFQISISQSVDTPVYRNIYEDVLLGMLQQNKIDLELFLQNSSLPFADNLLAQLQTRKQENMELQPE